MGAKSWALDRPRSKFYMVTANSCGHTVYKFLDVARLAPRVMRWLLGFWQI